MRLLLIVAHLFAAIALASKCNPVKATGCYLCGKVNNDTPWPLRMTQVSRALQLICIATYDVQDPSGLTGNLPQGWDLCDIFNWDGDKRCPNNKPCKCHQEVVAAGKSRGGNSCKVTSSHTTYVLQLSEHRIKRASGRMWMPSLLQTGTGTIRIGVLLCLIKRRKELG
jgi:hypothetical protein